MLPIETIARVTVNVERSAASPKVFDTGLLMVRDLNFADARRLNSVSNSSEAATLLSSYGFGDTTEAWKAAQKYFAASPSPSRLLVSCYPSSETAVQALDAVLDITADFYGICYMFSLTAEDYLTLLTHISGLDKPMMLFIPVTGTVASVTAANSLLDQLHSANAKRAVVSYASAMSDAAAVMGTAMGLQTAHESSAFSLCYKAIGGIQPSSLTQAQVDAIQALNGNVYVTRGYSHYLFEKGSTPSGYRYDEVLYTDMIARDLQDAAVSLLAENPDRLPQTDDSSAQFMNAFSSVLIGYTNRGILATAPWRGSAVGNLRAGDYVENGFSMWADSYDNQPEADRAAHKAVPIQVALTMAGSLESIVINVNVRV